MLSGLIGMTLRYLSRGIKATFRDLSSKHLTTGYLFAADLPGVNSSSLCILLSQHFNI